MADIYQADDYFGVCPTCLNAEGCNIRREYWMYCREHRVKWRIGENLFSGWRYETEEQWSKNAELLKDFREIEAHSSYQNSIAGESETSERCTLRMRAVHCASAHRYGRGEGLVNAQPLPPTPSDPPAPREGGLINENASGGWLQG